MKEIKGISLIVLVITIVVIIILAGAVILSLANNNPIASANEATFESNVASYNSELALVISKEYLQDNLFSPSAFNKGVWDGTGGNVTGTIKQYITSITPEDGAKFEIQSGKIVYVGIDETEENWLTNIGILCGTKTPPVIEVNVIATENSTVTGQATTYDNPIIPKGFKAINNVTTWPTDWNTGLVIEDESGNQFVWVPIDGINIVYEKDFTYPAWYMVNFSNITEDILPQGVVEEDQITKYGGFYIARYESMFDYNDGNMRAASKKSIDKEDTTSWSGARDSAHTGYLWNYIDYTDAKIYAESMCESYGYDSSKILTHLITGTEWDVTMKWLQNSGKSVTNSTTWGNHTDSAESANVEGHGSIQISGFSEYWKSNNIYDLAGNVWEWTNEKCASNEFIVRSGKYNYGGIECSSAFRNNVISSYLAIDTSFRLSLYIK
ncbi:MAG: SUMF1/EgtB/PvdO family nonheme iron enzyme [Clostridia bacterium]|nr:SUMF1/EgtB/PvdO family nonheme iron enzyme [Clostridia bacterium]MDD4386952.1 SUMF1/EgtB/PvdO family nonheme iron enzyme [Clostridia bacterium]